MNLVIPQITTVQAVRVKIYAPLAHNTAYPGDLWCPRPDK